MNVRATTSGAVLVRSRRRLLVPLAFAVLAVGARAEPDEALLGKDSGYPVGTAATWNAAAYRVGSWSAMDEVRGLPTRRVAAPAQASPLPLASTPAPIRYRLRNVGYSLDEYLARRHVTGLLILKDCHIVAERYRYGRTSQARFLSFSMAKSITSLLVGIALERGAFWVLAHDGHERVSGYFNATLRDWGRLGCMLARDGRVGERQVVPREYLLDATDPARQPAAFRPGAATRYSGYGFQFWLMPMRERTFALQGIHDQAMYVQPASGIVMVQTAVEDAPSARQDPLPAQERNALWRGVLKALGGTLD